MFISKVIIRGRNLPRKKKGKKKVITITITEEEANTIINMIEEKEIEIHWKINESFSNIQSVKAQKEKRIVNSIRNKIWEEDRKKNPEIWED